MYKAMRVREWRTKALGKPMTKLAFASDEKRYSWILYEALNEAEFKKAKAAILAKFKMDESETNS